MSKIKIAIIDSGIGDNVTFADKIAEKFTISNYNGDLHIEKGMALDNVGHGTAVASLISKNDPEVEMYIFKIFDIGLNTTVFQLVFSLNYIYNYCPVKIINISSGVLCVDDFDEINTICRRLSEKGVIIVSAFDNDGAISYPAALKSVIGVDASRDMDNKNDMCFVESDVINVILPDIFHRVEWVNPPKTIVKGASFSAAKLTSIIIDYIKLNNDADTDDVLAYLKSASKLIFRNNSEKINLRPPFDLNKAIVFPYSKETSALARYSNLLNFKIVDIFDDKYKGNVNKVMYNFVIKSFDEIDWECDFDTFILGCCDELSRLVKRNYKKLAIDMCIKNKKNLYSFERLEYSKDNIYFPQINSKAVPQNRFAKLRKNNLPVIGVFGTSVLYH